MHGPDNNEALKHDQAPADGDEGLNPPAVPQLALLVGQAGFAVEVEPVAYQGAHPQVG